MFSSLFNQKSPEKIKFRCGPCLGINITFKQPSQRKSKPSRETITLKSSRISPEFYSYQKPLLPIDKKVKLSNLPCLLESFTRTAAEACYKTKFKLLHLPPLRLHCIRECGDWTQDCCNVRISSHILNAKLNLFWYLENGMACMKYFLPVGYIAQVYRLKVNFELLIKI